MVAVDGWVNGVQALFWWSGGAGSVRRVDGGRHVDLGTLNGGCEGLGAVHLAVVGRI